METKNTTQTTNADAAATQPPQPYKGLTGATIVPLGANAVPNADQEAEILACYMNLHRLLAVYGKDALPAWEKVGAKSRGKLHERAEAALAAAEAKRFAEEKARITQGVGEVVEPLINAHRQAKVEYDTAAKALPESVRKLLQPFPAHIDVPLSDLSHLFAEGTPVGTQANKLERATYKVVKTAQDTFVVRIPVPFTSGEAKTDAAKAAA